MRDINQWMIKFGSWLILIGSIALFSIIIFFLLFSYMWGRVMFSLIFLLVVGIICLSLGFFFLFKGIQNMYFKPMKQLLYPHLRPPVGNPLSQQQIRHCQRCKRQIPMDSKWCPYCSNRSPDYYGVTLK